MMKNELLENIEKLHTTPMGIDRIRRNLQIGHDVKDVVVWCRQKILDTDAEFIRQGKNWYVRINDCIFTVNAYSYTIITAKTAESIAQPCSVNA